MNTSEPKTTVKIAQASETVLAWLMSQIDQGSLRWSGFQAKCLPPSPQSLVSEFRASMDDWKTESRGNSSVAAAFRAYLTKEFGETALVPKDLAGAR